MPGFQVTPFAGELVGFVACISSVEFVHPGQFGEALPNLAPA